MDKTIPHGERRIPSTAEIIEQDRQDRERAKAFREQTEWDESPDDLDDAWAQHEEEKAAEKAVRKGSESSTDWIKDFARFFEPGAEPAATEQPKENAEPEPVAAQTADTPITNTKETAVRKHRSRRPAPARKLPHGHCTGVWIPKAVYEDPRFESLTEMLLYLEINHLDNENGCIARNQHFAEYLGCNVQTIQDMIRSMAEREILLCVYPSRTRRVIHIAGGKKAYPKHRG
jgi:hypothetical protein